MIILMMAWCTHKPSFNLEEFMSFPASKDNFFQVASANAFDATEHYPPLSELLANSTEFMQQSVEGSLEEAINLIVDNGEQDKEENSQRKDFGMVYKNDEMVSLFCLEQWNPNLERSQHMISLIQEECPNSNVWTYIIEEFETTTEEEDKINLYDETAFESDDKDGKCSSGETAESFMYLATNTHGHSILESSMRLPVFESGQQSILPEYSHRKSCTSAYLPLDKLVLEYVKVEFEAVDTENLHLKLEVVEGSQGGWNGYCVLDGENDKDGRIEDAELFCGSDSKQDHHTKKEGHHIQRHGSSTGEDLKENKDAIQKILSSIIEVLECGDQEDFRLDDCCNAMAGERNKALIIDSQGSDLRETFEPWDTTILREPLTDPGSCFSETKDNIPPAESRSIGMEYMNYINSQESAPGVFSTVEHEISFEKGSCSSYTMEAALDESSLLEPSISQQLVLNESSGVNRNAIIDDAASLLNAEGSLLLRVGQGNELMKEIIVKEETVDFNNSVTESRGESLLGISMELQPLYNVRDIESSMQEAILQRGPLSEAENTERYTEDFIGLQIQEEDIRLDDSSNVMAEEGKKTLTMESQGSDFTETFEPSDATISRELLSDPGFCFSETKDNIPAPESRSINMGSMNNRNSQESALGVFATVEQESSFEKGSCSSYILEGESDESGLLESSISQQLLLNEFSSLNRNFTADVAASPSNAEGSLLLRIGKGNEMIDGVTVNEETLDYRSSVTEGREESLVGSSMELQPLDNVRDIESSFQEAILQPGLPSEAENTERNCEDLIGLQIQDEGEGTSLGSSTNYVPLRANRASSVNRESSSSSSSNDWDSSESDSIPDLESSTESDFD